jgi:glycosyltransferase involved in cell wall biosynthesis
LISRFDTDQISSTSEDGNFMMKVGLTAFDDDSWASVKRTYNFYRHTLAKVFDLSEIAETNVVEASERFDAIVNFKGSRAWLERDRIACPVLYGMHGGLIVNHAFVLKNLPRLRTCDALLVNCTSDEAIVRGWFDGDGPRLVHLSLPVESGSEVSEDRAESRRALGIADGDAVLGFVARLLPAKNLHGFLRMLMQVRRELKPRPVSAVIVGNYWLDYPLLAYCTSDYPRYIKGLIENLGQEEKLIYFPASLTNEELHLVYGAMDALVHPTYGIDENFGYVPIEAMGRGVPVVGAAYGGLKDTIWDGTTGHLMATWTTTGGIRMDTQGGVGRIIELLTDPERRAAMSRAAWLHAVECYSERRCAAALVTAVREAALASPSSASVRLIRKLSAEPLYPRQPILPQVDRNWFEFDYLVARYVSCALPRLRDGDVLSAVAPVLLEQGGARLDDPAWPIAEPLEERAKEILAELPFGSSRVVTETWPERETAQMLVAKGWLTVHRQGWETP